MPIHSKHANYLHDLGYLLREAGEEAKQDTETAASTDSAFHKGRLMAYVEVLSLMQQQAVAFGLPLSDLGLDGLNPERDLLG